MSPTFSVIVPVLDGAHFLPELLDAVRSQGREVEVLVVDSGSCDDSVAIARAARAEVIEIPRGSFGHGRTRNLAAQRSSGELICFITQDATPLPGWLDAYEQAFALADDIGAAFGPHLPRPDTSVMIARELTEFFAGFAPDGEIAVLDADGPMFLSNVNACYRRECWEQIRFDDVAYSEDQAFARAMGTHGWLRAYQPSAAVLHAHDFSPIGFVRRYFDEYRGLRETSGHIEHFGVRTTVRDVRGLVASDRRWMRDQGWSGGRRASATGRAVFHHASRKLAAIAGSRADRLPGELQRALSLEGRAFSGPVAAAPGPKPPIRQPARGGGYYQSVAKLSRDGVMPLAPAVTGMSAAERLHIAVVIPHFRRGSGGHSTIYNLLSRLEERGHTVSTWVYDPPGRHATDWPGVIRHDLREYFRPIAGPVYKGFGSWYGADIALATGWDTVYPVLRLPNCRSRAYLVQDHEPEFFATSAESVFAERSYVEGLYCIAASPWLADLVKRRYGAQASSFQLGVDHDVYRPREVSRRRDTVIFYAREVTPRRAVPLGVLALQELQRRRPNVRFVFFGNEQRVETPFAYEDLGVASPEELSWAYSEATVGLSLSLTNYSLIPQEMLACGLPCVELAGRSIESVFGDGGPIELTAADPIRIADALERLLGDPALQGRRAREGMAFVAAHSWDRAAFEVEDGLRKALWARELTTRQLPEPTLVELEGPVSQTLADAARTIGVDYFATRAATDRLYARLSPEDVEAVVDRLDPEMRADWNRADEDQRRTLALILGTWYEVPSVLDKTGLNSLQPPDDVHAMARGPLAGGGALYYADLIADSLRRVGDSIDDVRRGLDFGCSSGRVVRALNAAFPQTEWHGVDPNEGAIAWAREHLDGIEFQVSSQDPPLPYEQSAFDLVVAISIWSHYDENAAILWLDEMHRVIRSGGLLVFSTHGLHSISHYARTGERSATQLAAIRRALYQRDYWFAPEFGEEGDWGVKHPEWGTAFFTPEWLTRIALPAWTLEDFAVGQNAENQDIYVLRRR